MKLLGFLVASAAANEAANEGMVHCWEFKPQVVGKDSGDPFSLSSFLEEILHPKNSKMLRQI